MLAGLRIQQKDKSPKASSRKDKKKARKKEQKKKKKRQKDAKKAKDKSSSSSESSAKSDAVAEVPSPNAPTSGKAGGRESWMLPASEPAPPAPRSDGGVACEVRSSGGSTGAADFFSSLGSVRGKKEDKPNPDAVCVSERELNPALKGEETSQPTATSISSIPAHLKVGDGGSAWRKRAQKRLQQGAANLPPPVPAGADADDGPGLQWGGSRGQKRATQSDPMERQRQMLAKHREQLKVQQEKEQLEQQQQREQQRQRCARSSSRGQSHSRSRERRGKGRSRSRSRGDRGRGSPSPHRGRGRSRSQSRDRLGGGAVARSAAKGAGTSDGWRRRAAARQTANNADAGTVGGSGVATKVEAPEDVEDVIQRMQSKYGGSSASGGSSAAGATAPAAGSSDAAAAGEDEDANTLGAMAMQAMLEGDMQRYEELNRRLEQTQAKLAAAAGDGGASRATNGEKTVVLEELDASGRNRSLLDSVQSSSVAVKGKKRGIANTGTAKGGKDTGFYADDDVSLDDLIRKEKVEGVQDYDANLASHILKKPKFKQLHDDDDEAYALGWYESADKKLDAKKLAERSRRKEVQDKQQIQRNLERCDRCMESKKFRPKEAVLSVSPRAYLCAESFNQCILPNQVFISPQEHVQAVTDLDEAACTEIRNYQKCLVRYFEAQEPPKAVIFAESAVHRVSKDQTLLGGGPHAAVVAYPVDLALLSEARAYFKKAFDEAECEWSAQHKKVLPTSAKGGIREAIPKNFPYVHIDFCLGGGYAHVVEDAGEFPKDFAQQTIAGMCELTVLDRGYATKDLYWDGVKDMKRRFADGFDWAPALGT